MQATIEEMAKAHPGLSRRDLYRLKEEEGWLPCLRDALILTYDPAHQAKLKAANFKFRHGGEACVRALGAEEINKGVFQPGTSARVAKRVVLFFQHGGSQTRANIERDVRQAIGLKAQAVGVFSEHDGEAFEGCKRVGFHELPADIKLKVLQNAYDDALAVSLPGLGDRQGQVAWPFIAAPKGDALFQRVKNFLKIQLPGDSALAGILALWCMHAWLHVHSETSPRLVLNGGQQAGGVSRVLRILRWLLPAPHLLSHASLSDLLKLTDGQRPSLLIEDIGGSILGQRNIRTMLAAGAKSDGAVMHMASYEDGRRLMRCASPVVIGMMGDVPAEIAARALVFELNENTADAPLVSGNLGPAPPEAIKARLELCAFARDFRHESVLKVSLCTQFTAAEADLWQPLYNAALPCGALALDELFAAKKHYAQWSNFNQSSIDRLLLLKLKSIQGGEGKRDLPTAQILEELNKDLMGAWAGEDMGVKLSGRALAERLRRLGLRPKVIYQPDGNNFRGYKGEALQAVFAREMKAE